MALVVVVAEERALPLTTPSRRSQAALVMNDVVFARSCLQPKCFAVNGVFCSKRVWLSAGLSAAKEQGRQRSCLQPKSLVVGGVVGSQRAWLSAELSAAKKLDRQRSCLQPKSLVVSGVVCSQRAWLSPELSAIKELGCQRSCGRPDMLSLRLENVFRCLVFSATLAGCDGTSLNLRFLWAFGLFCPERSLTRATCFSLERR